MEKTPEATIKGDLPSESDMNTQPLLTNPGSTENTYIQSVKNSILIHAKKINTKPQFLYFYVIYIKYNSLEIPESETSERDYVRLHNDLNSFADLMMRHRTYFLDKRLAEDVIGIKYDYVRTCDVPIVSENGMSSARKKDLIKFMSNNKK